MNNMSLCPTCKTPDMCASLGCAANVVKTVVKVAVVKAKVIPVVTKQRPTKKPVKGKLK